MAKEILNIQAHDGSRLFMQLPVREDWYAVCDHVKKLSGAQITEFLCDDITEAWIDFIYKDQSFSINDQFGEYLFFVRDTSCPEKILHEVKKHFDTFLF